MAMAADPDNLTELSKELKTEIGSAQQCNFGPEMGPDDTPQCTEQATCVMIYREVCAGGQPIEGPYTYLLCNVHRNLVLGMMSPNGHFLCVACGDHVIGASHLVLRVTQL